jgi:hypothetical protein
VRDAVETVGYNLSSVRLSIAVGAVAACRMEPIRRAVDKAFGRVAGCTGTVDVMANESGTRWDA